MPIPAYAPVRPRSLTKTLLLAIVAAASLCTGAQAARPVNDSFSSATVIAGQSGTVNGTTSEATVQSGEVTYGTASIWYRWTAPVSAAFTFNTFGSGYDTKLLAATGATVSTTTTVTSNDDGGRDHESSISFSAIAGTNYYLRISSADGSKGATVLNWDLSPANDAFANATALSGDSGSITGDNRLATKEASETLDGFQSVWFRWTATFTGTAEFTTAGSAIDTNLTFGTGTSLGTFRTLKSNDNSPLPDAGFTSRVRVPVTAGTTYRIRVGSYRSGGGSYTLNWAQKNPGPMLDLTSTFVPKVTFTQNSTETLVADPEGFGFYPEESGSTSITMMTSTAGIDLSTITGSSVVGFELGDYFHYAKLEEADTLSSNRAVFYLWALDPETFDAVRTGTITYAWTASTLTITAGFKVEAGTIYTPKEGVEEVVDVVDTWVAFGTASGARTVYVDGTVTTTDRYVGGEVDQTFNLTTIRLTGSADYTPPKVTITSPVDKLRILQAAGSTLEVKGTMSDNQSPGEVRVSLNGADFETVDFEFDVVGEDEDGFPIESALSGKWTASLDLVAGPNVVRVQAIDGENNASAIVSRTYNFVVPATLQVNTVGSGSVTAGFLGTTTREVGMDYAVTATPAAGFVFDGWTGDFPQVDPLLRFTMRDPVTITANFVPNPYTAGDVPGIYTATVDAGAFGGNGYLWLKLLPTGRYTGYVLLGGLRQTVTGSFTSGGLSSASFKLRDGSIVRLDLALGAASPHTISGTLTHGGFISTITGGRELHGAKNLYTGPKSYTMLLEPAPGALPDGPAGAGVAVLTFSRTGAARAVGTLADGTPWSAAAPIGAGGGVALYMPLYLRLGSLTGRLSLEETAGVSDAHGTFLWSKPARPKDLVYKPGFSRLLSVTASVYTRPVAPQRILTSLDASNGVASATLSLGETGALSPIAVNVSTLHKFAVAANPVNLTLNVNSINGLVSGLLKHPVDKKLRPIKGIVFQKRALAAGHFRGTTTYGRVDFVATP